MWERDKTSTLYRNSPVPVVRDDGRDEEGNDGDHEEGDDGKDKNMTDLKMKMTARELPKNEGDHPQTKMPAQMMTKA